MSENRERRRGSGGIIRDMEQLDPLGLDPVASYRALRTRDERFDGRLFVGVTSTGIYCRPICPARTPIVARNAFTMSTAKCSG